MNVPRRLVLFLALASLFRPADGAKPLDWQPLGEPGCGGAIVDLAVDPLDSRHLVCTGDMLGATVSSDRGDSWQPAFGFISDEMAGITFRPGHPGEVWVGSCTGPYRSTDGGSHYQSMREGMPPLSDSRYTAMVERVLFDPKDGNRLLAFGGSSRHWNECETFGWIWESKDSGRHWSHAGTISKDGFSTGNTGKGANIVEAAIAPDGTWHLLADGAGWFASTDGGRTWNRRQPKGLPATPRSFTLDPKNAKIVWAATGSYLTDSDESTRQPGGIYQSTDSGQTFAARDTGIAKVNARSGDWLSSTFANVVVSAANPNVLYTCDGAWNAGILYQSGDGGGHWKAVAARQGIGVSQDAKARGVFHPQTATYAGLSMTGVADPASADRTYWFNTEFILRSVDGGRTWDDATSSHPDPKAPELWHGRGWEGWCATNFAWNPYRPQQAIAQGMDDSRAWISEDGLQSWRYASTAPHPWLADADVTFSKDGHLFVSTGQFNQNNGLLRSSDWGRTWTLLEGPDHGLPKAGWGCAPEYGGIHVHPGKSNLVWVVSGGKLLHSTDGGDHWQAIDGPTECRRISPDPTSADRFYVTAKDGVWVTDDGGKFTPIGGPAGNPRGGISCDSRGRVLVCQWRGETPGVWRYTPAEKSWQRLLDESLAYACAADPADPSRLLMITNMDPYCDLAGGHGVWISADDGKSWSPENDGLPVLRGQAVAFNPTHPGQIVVGTFGRGFFVADWPKTFQPSGSRHFSEPKKPIHVP